MAIQLLSLFRLLFLGLTVAGQEAYQMLPLHDPSHLVPTTSPVAVPVTVKELPAVASSVLQAETWLRARVLAYFPSTNITTIVVGSQVLCNKKHSQQWPLVLPAFKNLYHSLLRWGLQREIRLSPAFSGDCTSSQPETFPVEPLLAFIHSSGGSYSINPSLHSSPAKVSSLVSIHVDFMKKLGSFRPAPINVLTSSQPTKRRLSSSGSKLVRPYPARPTPLPPLRSSIGVPNPISPPSSHDGDLSSVSPSTGVITPPPETFDFAPPVDVAPASPPQDAMVGPPCVAVAAPPPAKMGEEKGMWCVAKPSVPEETLQEAMDYACGEGGGDCDAIIPSGRCYLPNTMVSHASYAFNSYWQKNKNNGGTCNFGGAAMVITSDPSFHHCRFILL